MADMITITNMTDTTDMINGTNVADTTNVTDQIDKSGDCTKASLHLYYVDHRKILPVLWDGSYRSVPMPERYLHRIAESSQPSIQCEAFASGYLLSRVLSVQSDTQLQIGVHGALSLSENYLSLSHARDFTVLGVCSVPLGVDIEEIAQATDDRSRARRLRIAQKTFPAAFRSEYETVFFAQKQPPQTPEAEGKLFTRLWTCVEAVLKAEGTGFRMVPEQYETCFLRWQLQSVQLADHIISVATPKPVQTRSAVSGSAALNPTEILL